MNLLHKWCLKKTVKSKYYPSLIWIVFITVLLLMDIGVSKDGSVIHFHSKDLEQINIVSDNGMISNDEYIRCEGIPDTKVYNVKSSIILNVIDNNDNMSYKFLQGNDCMFYISFMNFNTVTTLYVMTLIIVCGIIFFLEKILLFIQNNDGKKRNIANCS